MAEFTSATTQTVEPNQNILFTETSVKGCPSIVHREGSGLITLRGLSRTQCRARFRADFSANIAIAAGGATSPISVAFALDGEPVNSTVMIVTPADVEQFFNVSAAIYIDVPVDDSTQLSVESTSSAAIRVANPNIIVERVA